MAAEDPKQIEMTAIIREIQDRVRARYPMHTAGSAEVALPDLMPVLHARDRAEGKVAAIGTVNPRPAGFSNNLIQSFKRTVARGLNWFIRDQIEFNRAAMDCMNALIDVLNENNRAMASLVNQYEGRISQLRTEADAWLASSERLMEESSQLKDMRVHWAEWRQDWERKLSINEVQFLRNVADLQTAFQHRATLMESNFRDLTGSQHRDFTVALDSARIDIQQRLWSDLEKARLQFEKLIHNELRVMRQRAVASAPAAAAPVAEAALAGSGGIQLDEPPIDYLRFSDRFRGTEEHVRKSQQRYLHSFEGSSEVLDLGCGRGEFLEVLRDAGMLVKGIDSNGEMIAICRSKGLYAEQADLFHYLGELDEASLDGIFCGQVVEHLPPARLTELISLASAALRPGGRLVIETPNPACLAIFATHFYLDPTHQRPVPAPLLVFYLEESGFGNISVDYINMAADSFSELKELPEGFREGFFGGLDYSVSSTRL